MTGELAELDSLQGEALTVDLQIAPAVPDQSQPPDTEAAQPVDRLAEAKALIGIMQPLIVMALPCVKDAPPAEWDALHQPVADCLAFYDVDVSKYLAHPLAALAFAAVPLVMRGVNNWQEKAEKPKQPEQLPIVPDSSGEPVPGTAPRA